MQKVTDQRGGKNDPGHGKAEEICGEREVKVGDRALRDDHHMAYSGEDS